jgi:hypothetical protein
MSLWLPFAALLALAPGQPVAEEGASAPGLASGPSGGTITAIGDIHGDLETFERLLRKAGLTDERGAWSGGTRRVVQTGDYLDRGAASRRVMDLLQRLQGEARAAGGEVTVLLGNHEVMNLVGDLRYVLPEEFAGYLPEEEPELRGAERAKILSLLAEGSPLLVSRYYGELAREITPRTFDTVFPPGYFAHRRALAPEGAYGKWLLGLPLVHVEGETLFVHGGLTVKFGLAPAASINDQARKEVRLYLAAVKELEDLGVYRGALGLGVLAKLMEAERAAGGPSPALEAPFRTVESVFAGILFHEASPTWDRSAATGDERLLARDVERVLEAHGVRRMVIGHTQPKSLDVEARFGGKVYLIDTGMNQSYYKGTPSVLLLTPGDGVDVLRLDVSGQASGEAPGASASPPSRAGAASRP